MSGRRISVDLGPMSLMLDDAGLASPSALAAASTDDVLRLRALLRAGAGASQDRPSPAGDPAGECFGSAPGDVGKRPVASAAMPGDAVLALLASELTVALRARLARPDVTAAETRLALRPVVLRDAELAVATDDGGLAFSLWVGHADDREWLAGQLPALAAMLGERLGRRLQLRVFDPAHADRAVATRSWPAEVSA